MEVRQGYRWGPPASGWEGLWAASAEKFMRYPQGAPSISLTGAPGTRRQRQRSEAHVLRSESRGGPGSTRSQGEECALSVHQGLPIPEQRGPHEGLISPPSQPQKSQAVLTAPRGATSLLPSGSQGTDRPGGTPLWGLRVPLKRRPVSGLCQTTQGAVLNQGHSQPLSPSARPVVPGCSPALLLSVISSQASHS